MLPVLIIIPLILAIVIYMLSFKDGKQVCDNYVLISYLYALFYICLTAYITMMIFLNLRSILNYLFTKDVSIYIYIAILVAILIAYIALYFVTILLPPKFVILKHVLSLFVILLGSILLSIIFFTYAPDAIFVALILTILLFIVLTIIAWKFQDYISSKVSIVFLIVFLILILMELILIIFFPNSILTSIIIFIVLLALCYMLLVRTKIIIENSKTCKEYPDYVQEGLGLYLSFKNILLQILQLRSRRR